MKIPFATFINNMGSKKHSKRIKMPKKENPNWAAIKPGIRIVGQDQNEEPIIAQVVDKRSGPRGTTDIVVVDQNGNVRIINDGSHH